jgi:YYY domain-containing protein
MIGQSIGQAALWFAWLLLLGAVAFPLLARLLPALPSRGIALAPAFGLLLVGYLAWIGASLHLVPFGRASLLGAVVIVAALSVLSEVAARGRTLRWLGRHIPEVIFALTVLAVAFVFFVWVRGFAPDIRNTEKPMEIGFLTSTMRARWMPPHDPWLAGYGINYYYFGYVLAGALGLLSGMAPEVTFNLTGPTLFALTFTGASGITFDLLARFRRERRLRYARRTTLPAALAGGLLVAVAGNAYGFVQFLHAPVATVRDYFWTGIGWNSTRVIYDEVIPGKPFQMITEFPFFSFILGDNHPHVLGLPIVLLSIAVALGWWFGPASGKAGRWEGRKAADAALSTQYSILSTLGNLPWDRLLLSAVVVGALYPTNAWDLPTFTLPVVLALVVRRPRAWRRSLVRAGIVVAGLFVLYAPYYAHFKSLVGHTGDEPAFVLRLTRIPVLGWAFDKIVHMLGLVTWPHTDLRQFLYVFAVPLLAAATLVLRGLAGRATAVSPWARQRLTIATIGVLLVALVTKTAMLVPTGALALGAVVALTRPIQRQSGSRKSRGVGKEVRISPDAPTARLPDFNPWRTWTPTDRLATWLVLYGAFLPMIPEFVFLRDAFDNRMNTMFKVDYQSWVLLMLAGAYGIVSLVLTLRESSRQQAAGSRQQSPGSALFDTPVAASLISGTLVVFALMAVTYPAIVTYQKTGHFTGSVGTDFPGIGLGWQGLDGLGYVQQTNPDEYRAAMWLRAHAGQDDRVLEAVGNSYGDSNGWFQSRFGAATGVPDLLGWYFHEVQWRNGDPDMLDHVLPARAADIGTMYNTTNASDARALLKQYDVRWVVIGADETQGIGKCAVSAGCPPYAPAGIAKFTDMLDLAFRSGPVSIFRVL